MQSGRSWKRALHFDRIGSLIHRATVYKEALVMPEIYLSLGSNLDQTVHIPSALRRLRALFGELVCSGLYESDPVGCTGPVFHNLVVACHTELSPDEVLACLHRVEDQEGRVRGTEGLPHTLDIDLLLYGDAVLQRGRLRVPREDIIRHAFVLEPLAEMAPDAVHPVLGQSYAELWKRFDSADVRQKRMGSVVY
jgi:2-amino-4-hydroxy-6-hydroxymethyldihydropteridine diphosphokinase